MSPDTVLLKDRLCHLQLSEYDATFKNTPIFPFTGIVGVFHNHGTSYPWDAHLNTKTDYGLTFTLLHRLHLLFIYSPSGRTAALRNIRFKLK